MTDCLKITDNFFWEEVTASRTGEGLGIDNTLPEELKPVTIRVANKMEIVRVILDNNPIHCSSWYRSPELNKAVGGSKTSQHMKGEAIDFTCMKFGSVITCMKKLITFSDVIQFDQLIYEHSWIHISFLKCPDSIPRRQVLTLVNGGSYAIGLTDKRGKPV